MNHSTAEDSEELDRIEERVLQALREPRPDILAAVHASAASSDQMGGSTGEITRRSLIDQIRSHRRALTAEELAVYLAMTKQHIYKLAKAGRMPSYRLGGAVRFDPAATASWLESKLVT